MLNLVRCNRYLYSKSNVHSQINDLWRRTSIFWCLKQKFSMSAPQGFVDISEKVKTIPENVWVKTVSLVLKHKPVNLGQGFPDFPEIVPKHLHNALIKTQTPDADFSCNQYARGQGHPTLVTEIADLYGTLLGREIDPMKEIIVTIGGYEALHCSIHAVANPGDEVILIEPFFDSYSETIRDCGAVARCIPLKLREGGTTSSDFVFDRAELRGMFNKKTKAIIVNTPHNPTGKVFNREEIEFIAELCKEHNVLYISDEVYEWLVYDPHEHIRVAALPDMWDRTVTICSAGKTFNATGWKTGWAIGPERYITACMKIHQGIIYTIPTPLQIALAEAFRIEKKLIGTEHSYWFWLKDLMKKKRDRIYGMLSAAGLKPILPDGGYFIVCDVSGLRHILPDDYSSGVFDARLSQWLIEKEGMACIPVSAFFSKDHKADHETFLRFCFIKADKTLDMAEEKFKKMKFK